jgi:hypothetical protein
MILFVQKIFELGKAFSFLSLNTKNVRVHL